MRDKVSEFLVSSSVFSQFACTFLRLCKSLFEGGKALLKVKGFIVVYIVFELGGLNWPFFTYCFESKVKLDQFLEFPVIASISVCEPIDRQSFEVQANRH
jgi:hypothetical protein